MKNEVEGIGLAPRDETELWGSAGHFKSALFINFRLMGPLIHELAHNWANYLELFENVRWGGHWGVSDVRGVLGGNVTTFEKIEEGVYAVNANAPASYWSGRYADFELYLMGLVSAAEVPEHHLMRDFSVVGFDDDRNKVLLRGRVDTVRVEDIIRRMGERVPAYEISQKAFSMATVVVSFAPLSALELAYYDRQTQLLAADADSDHSFAAATGGRATLDTRLDPMITAVREGQRAVDGLPTSPLLMQNVPNPFNSSTAIEYALLERGDVELAIYNAVGQQVVVLAKGERLAGHYTVHWDGKDALGRALASGVYFYQLRTNNNIERRKLSLIQ